MKHTYLFALAILFILPFSCKNSSGGGDVSEMIENGKFKQASESLLLQNVEEVDEKQLYMTAQYFSEKTAYMVSMPLLEKLLEKNPSHVAGRLMLANNYRETKRDDNYAIKEYSDLANIDSIRFIVLPERARLYIRLDEVARAEADIAEAKSIQPKYFASFLADGLLQYSQGHLDAALDLLEISENLDPGFSAEASLYAGYILLKNNLNYDAMGKFSKAIEVRKNINMGYAFINRGVCQVNLQDTSYACADFDSGAHYMPEQAQTYIENYCKSFRR